MKLSELKHHERLYVFKGEVLAAELSRTPQGSSFQYTEEFLKLDLGGIAFKIPPRKDPFLTTGDNLLPFFAGLLPEGMRLNALLHAVKSSANDMFTLLAASGGDAIGDVTVHIEKSGATSSLEYSPEVSTKVDFYKVFEESISATDYKLRVRDPGIPGVHPKISGQMISFPVIAKNKRYILKLNPPNIPRLVENENFFMNMARAVGLATAETTLVHDAKGNAGLLVERFDRIFIKDRGIVCLHQEDSCQFLDRYPQDKYRLSMREIGRGIEEWSTSPLLEIGALIKLAAFSYIIGNGNLHAKNISLLTDPNTKNVKLAPAYDLLSTVPYGDMHMALQLEGRDDNITRKDFIQFAESFGVRAAVVNRILSELENKCPPWVAKLQKIGLEEKLTKNLARIITKRLLELTT